MSDFTILPSFTALFEQHLKDASGQIFPQSVPVRFMHTSDQEYAEVKGTKDDPLGFQAAMVLVAHPFDKTCEELLIRDVTDVDYQKVAEWYQEYYFSHFSECVHQDKQKHHYHAEFATWDEFVRAWCVDENNQSLVQYNFPVLFDHVSDVDYWSWKKQEVDYCGYQRLIVTICQYRYKKFIDVFIKDVDDQTFQKAMTWYKDFLQQSFSNLFSS